MKKKEEMKICLKRYHSPCGDLMLGSYGDKLCLCDWTGEAHRPLIDKRIRKMLHADYEEGTSEILELTVKQLDEYFAGKRTVFTIPLLPIGTPFQKSVWQLLLDIPYGTVVSYSDLAHRLGKPTAVRAVAAANGANALSILIPCHRVIGSNRTLVGYAGGLPAKRLLLELEASER